MEVVLYVISSPDYLVLPYMVNCSVSTFAAFEDADKLPGVEEVMGKEPIEITKGLSITKPYPIDYLRSHGSCIFSSLSHEGIFASYSQELKGVEFVSLINKESAVVCVDNWTLIGFYDDNCIFITYGRPLREVCVNDIFKNKGQIRFQRLDCYSAVVSYTDVSVLNVTRVLAYSTTLDIPYEFNVDTKVSRRLSQEYFITSFICKTGIDINENNICIESSNPRFVSSFTDFASIKRLAKTTQPDIYMIIPSTSCNNDLENAMMFGCDNSIQFKGITLESIEIFKYTEYYSLVRLYKDVFIVYDANTSKWTLMRIMVE